MWFLNILIAGVGSCAGITIYVVSVGLENREPAWITVSAVAGAIVNRGLADIYRWLANKKAENAKT